METSASSPKSPLWSWAQLTAALALAVGLLLLLLGRSALPAHSDGTPMTPETQSVGASLLSRRSCAKAGRERLPVHRPRRAVALAKAEASATEGCIDSETVLDLMSDSAAELRAWAQQEPAAAAAWVERVGSQRATRNAFGVVACAWALKDLQAAMAWAEGITDPQDRSAATLAVAYEAVRTDAAEAVRVVADLPESEDKVRLLTHAAREWAVQDNKAALQWATAVPDAKTRETLISAIAIELAEADLELAVTLVSALTDPELQAHAKAALEQRRSLDSALVGTTSTPACPPKL